MSDKPIDLDAIERDGYALTAGESRALVRAVRDRDAEIARLKADEEQTRAVIRNACDFGLLMRIAAMADNFDEDVTAALADFSKTLAAHPIAKQWTDEMRMRLNATASLDAHRAKASQ